MATVDQQVSNGAQRATVPGRAARQPKGIFISTEARPAFVTTEFWLTLLSVVGLAILAYASDALGVRWGMGMATAVLLAYVLSRGLAKAGSSEVEKRDVDDFQNLSRA